VLVVPVIEAIDESSMASWIDVSVDCHFSLHNLPYGVLNPPGSTARIGTAIGEYALDLKCLARAHIFDNIGFNVEVLQDVDLNRYAALGKPVHLKVRHLLQDLLRYDTKLGHVLRDNAELRHEAFCPLDAVSMHMPFRVSEYTDFFCGLPHAETVRSVAHRT
jgi:fumarylacetoacetase